LGLSVDAFPVSEAGMMFSVLSKAVDFVLEKVLYDYNDNDDGDGGDNVNDDSPVDTQVIAARDQDNQDVLLTELVDIEEKKSDSKLFSFTGKVTQVFHNHGLIDGEVYFSAEAVCSINPIQAGDTVNVVARQQNKDGGWVAESVSVIESTWEDEEEAAPIVPTGEVGKITQFRARDGEGVINKNILFDVSMCREGYKPCAGDWVTVELDLDVSESSDHDGTKEATVNNAHDRESTTKNKVAEFGLNGNDNSGLNGGGGDEGDWFTEQQKDRQLYAKHVSPLREWCFEGEVTAAMSDHGYIDGEVYFKMDACLNGYRPR
jgi:hypothetical protein